MVPTGNASFPERKSWQPPEYARLGVALTATGAGNIVERYCVQAGSSSQCPGGGPPYPQVYAQNTAHWSAGCGEFVRGNNTAQKCKGTGS
jgi:hypothetical protein